MWHQWLIQQYCIGGIITVNNLPLLKDKEDYLQDIPYRVKVYVCQQLLHSCFPQCFLHGDTLRISRIPNERPLECTRENIHVLVKHLTRTHFATLLIPRLMKRLKKRKGYDEVIQWLNEKIETPVIEEGNAGYGVILKVVILVGYYLLRLYL